MRCDVIVLGAGMVGVSVALHLQKRGIATVLVDRQAPGRGASYGNAGLIQREAAMPRSFPRDWASLFRYGSNKAPELHYHWSALPRFARFLLAYRRNSAPDRYAAISRAFGALIEHSVSEHRAQAEEAEATNFLRTAGWIRVHRTQEKLEGTIAEAAKLEQLFGVLSRTLDRAEMAREEPHIDASRLAGAVHFTQPNTVTDPEGLTLAYAALFQKLGGQLVNGDARTLSQTGDGWSVQTEQGLLTAPRAVLALGAWSRAITDSLGYHVPLMAKRGYHMHYGSTGNAVLNHSVVDAERGFALAPMARGIRLTTGIEFAMMDAPPTPVQLQKVEPMAKELFPLAEHREAEPWMGFRPQVADMLPVLGEAPRHKGLWFSFGHGHQGLTLGPATGRLIAEMMTGQTPYLDPTPYSITRFDR